MLNGFEKIVEVVDEVGEGEVEDEFVGGEEYEI